MNWGKIFGFTLLIALLIAIWFSEQKEEEGRLVEVKRTEITLPCRCPERDLVIDNLFAIHALMFTKSEVMADRITELEDKMEDVEWVSK